MAKDTNSYINVLDKNILLQKYGMMKYQVTHAQMTRVLFAIVKQCGLVDRELDLSLVVLGSSPPFFCLQDLFSVVLGSTPWLHFVYSQL